MIGRGENKIKKNVICTYKEEIINHPYKYTQKHILSILYNIIFEHRVKEKKIRGIRTHVKPRQLIASASMSASSEGKELRAGK